MDKIRNILKNTLVFLVIFLALNYVISGFQKDEALIDSGNVIFTTTDNEYSRSQTVTLTLENNSTETIKVATECPNEPFNVYRYEQNEWVQKSVTPELDCSNTKDITVEPGQEARIDYKNWNYALFAEMGRFKVEFPTTLNGEEKILSSNEFVIVREGIFKQLWMAAFYRPIYNGLIFLAKVIPGNTLGLAIILLTLIIRTILLVPSHKALKSQKMVQELQPKIEEIKRKHKGDQQRIATETMALWKEAKVNPMGSCLPLLLQFPFLIAIFYVVRDGLNPDNAYLLYTQYQDFTLAQIDYNFLGLDLSRPNTYVLPLIIGGLQFFQMQIAMSKSKKKKNTNQNKEMAQAQSAMTYIMPVMIAVFTASLPSGVGIYWGTSTIYGIVQQLIINKTPTKKNPDEPTVKVIEK